MRLMSVNRRQGRFRAKGNGLGPHVEQEMEAVGQWQGSDPKQPKEASHSCQAGTAKLRQIEKHETKQNACIRQAHVSCSRLNGDIKQQWSWYGPWTMSLRTCCRNDEIEQIPDICSKPEG